MESMFEWYEKGLELLIDCNLTSALAIAEFKCMNRAVLDTKLQGGEIQDLKRNLTATCISLSFLIFVLCVAARTGVRKHVSLLFEELIVI